MPHKTGVTGRATFRTLGFGLSDGLRLRKHNRLWRLLLEYKAKSKNTQCRREEEEIHCNILHGRMFPTTHQISVVVHIDLALDSLEVHKCNLLTRHKKNLRAKLQDYDELQRREERRKRRGEVRR
jgi:hypothetical protein